MGKNIAPIKHDTTVQMIKTDPASKWKSGKHSISMLNRAEIDTIKNIE